MVEDENGDQQVINSTTYLILNDLLHIDPCHTVHWYYSMALYHI